MAMSQKWNILNNTVKKKKKKKNSQNFKILLWIVALKYPECKKLHE
jgi:hypothetical protein